MSPANVGGPGDLTGPRRSDDARQAAASARAQGSSRPAPAQGAAPSGPASDAVEISAPGRLLAELARRPEVRQELVEDLRRQLAEGALYDQAGLERAVNLMLDDL